MTAWTDFVKKTHIKGMETDPTFTLKRAMKQASKAWKKSRKSIVGGCPSGGAGADTTGVGADKSGADTPVVDADKSGAVTPGVDADKSGADTPGVGAGADTPVVGADKSGADTPGVGASEKHVDASLGGAKRAKRTKRNNKKGPCSRKKRIVK